MSEWRNDEYELQSGSTRVILVGRLDISRNDVRSRNLEESILCCCKCVRQEDSDVLQGRLRRAHPSCARRVRSWREKKHDWHERVGWFPRFQSITSRQRDLQFARPSLAESSRSSSLFSPFVPQNFVTRLKNHPRTCTIRFIFKKSRLRSRSLSWTAVCIVASLRRRTHSSMQTLVSRRPTLNFLSTPEPNGVDGRTPESSRVRVNSVPSPSYHRSEGPPSAGPHRTSFTIPNHNQPPSPFRSAFSHSRSFSGSTLRVLVKSSSSSSLQ